MKPSGNCPDKIKCTVVLDEDLNNMLDQLHLITNKSRSDLINDALRTQLYIPSKFSARKLKDAEDIVRSIVFGIFKENKPSEEAPKDDIPLEEGPRIEPASKFEKAEV